MTNKNEIYRCNICGNIVEVIHEGVGELVCCGESMELLKPQTEDKGYEKHVPVIEEIEEGIKIKVGSNPHPMEEKHYIEWIQVKLKNGKSYREYLEPGQEPKAEFPVRKEDVEKIREYCNVHGLWENNEIN